MVTSYEKMESERHRSCHNPPALTAASCSASSEPPSRRYPVASSTEEASFHTKKGFSRRLCGWRLNPGPLVYQVNNGAVKFSPHL